MSIALVQQHFSAASTTNAFTSNNVGGNTLVACFTIVTAQGTLSSVTDTLGNVWVQAGSGQTLSQAGIILQTFYCLSCKAGANTVTENGVAAAGVDDFWITEFSGIAAFDAAYGANTATCAGNPSVTFTPAQAGEMAITQCLPFGEQINGVPTGFTPLTGTTAREAAYDLSLPAGSQTVTWNESVVCPCPGNYGSMYLALFTAQATPPPAIILQVIMAQGTEGYVPGPGGGFVRTVNIQLLDSDGVVRTVAAQVVVPTDRNGYAIDVGGEQHAKLLRALLREIVTMNVQLAQLTGQFYTPPADDLPRVSPDT